MRVMRKVYFIIMLQTFSLFLFGLVYGKNNSNNTNAIVERVNNLFYRGLTSYINRDFKDATKYWQKALLLLPEDKKIKVYFEKAYSKFTKMEKYFYGGLGEFNNKKYRKAIKYFKKTLAINPRHKKALYYLKLCYEMLKVHLKIVDAPTSTGREIKDINLTTDSSLHLYAVGYDGANRFVGTVPVKWSADGLLDKIKETNFIADIIYSPETPDVEGKIKITLNNCYPDETGIIKVKQGSLAAIKIYSAPNSKGYEIIKLNLTTDSNVMLYAAGFDKNGAYINNVLADWSFSVNKFTRNKNNVKEFELFSTKAGAGNLVVTSKSGIKTVISNIVITHGKLKYLQIENSPDGNNPNIPDMVLTTDDTKIFYALGYDKFFNLIGLQNVNWTTTGNLQKIVATNRKKFIFQSDEPGISGRIKISKKGVSSAISGLIKIIPGATKFVLITTNRHPKFKKIDRLTLKAGEKFQLFSAGFDFKKNFKKLLNVYWTITGDDKKYLSNNFEGVFTNADRTVEVNIVHPGEKDKLKDNIKIIIVPAEINKLIVSDDMQNSNTDRNYVLSADMSKKFYAFFIDKFGNFVRKANVKWTLTNLAGRLEPINPAEALFHPEKIGKGILRAQISLSNNVDFTQDVKLQVVRGEPEDIAFYLNKNFITNKSSFSNIIFSKNNLEALLIDKNKNIIKPVKGKWNFIYNNKNYIFGTNTSRVQVFFTNKITSGIIKFISSDDTNFKALLNFSTIYPEIKFVKVLDFTNGNIVTNIVLDYNDKIKLESFAFDDEGRKLFPLDVKWKTSLSENKFLYNNILTTNILMGIKAGSQEKLIVMSRLVGKQVVANITINKPKLIIVSSSNIVTTKKVIIYDIYVGDTLGRIVSKILLIPYKWKYVYPYVHAIAVYNKINNVDLIYPKQTLYVPYFTVDEETTKQKLAEKLFGDEAKYNLIINYKKNYTSKIVPGDKIIIKDLKFISTGESKMFINKKEIIK